MNPDTLTERKQSSSRGEDFGKVSSTRLYLMDGKSGCMSFSLDRFRHAGRDNGADQAGAWQHIAGNLRRWHEGVWRPRSGLTGKLQKLNVLFDQLLWPIDHKEPWRVGAAAV